MMLLRRRRRRLLTRGVGNDARLLLKCPFRFCNGEQRWNMKQKKKRGKFRREKEISKGCRK